MAVPLKLKTHMQNRPFVAQDKHVGTRAQAKAYATSSVDGAVLGGGFCGEGEAGLWSTIF
jgi:hypothetical protein